MHARRLSAAAATRVPLAPGSVPVAPAAMVCLVLALCACGADPGYGGRSTTEWIRTLDDSSAARRTEAAVALGRVLDIDSQARGAVPALIGALADSVDAVRMAAASSLSAHGARAQGAIPGVHRALHDSAHAIVRAQAAIILGNLGAASRGEALLRWSKRWMILMLRSGQRPPVPSRNWDRPPYRRPRRSRSTWRMPRHSCESARSRRCSASALPCRKCCLPLTRR